MTRAGSFEKPTAAEIVCLRGRWHERFLARIVRLLAHVVHDVDPAHEELVVDVGALAGELGGGDDGHPLADDLHRDVGTVAVQLEIGIGLLLVVKGASACCLSLRANSR